MLAISEHAINSDVRVPGMHPISVSCREPNGPYKPMSHSCRHKAAQRASSVAQWPQVQPVTGIRSASEPHHRAASPRGEPAIGIKVFQHEAVIHEPSATRVPTRDGIITAPLRRPRRARSKMAVAEKSRYISQRTNEAGAMDFVADPLVIGARPDHQ